jgi:hypothetical protein
MNKEADEAKENSVLPDGVAAGRHDPSKMEERQRRCPHCGREQFAGRRPTKRKAKSKVPFDRWLAIHMHSWCPRRGENREVEVVHHEDEDTLRTEIHEGDEFVYHTRSRKRRLDAEEAVSSECDEVFVSAAPCTSQEGDALANDVTLVEQNNSSGNNSIHFNI